MVHLVNSLRAILVLVILFPGCAVSQQKNEMVCVTQTGTKYHLCDCRYITNGGEQITKTEAQERNLTACSVCSKPSALKDKADTMRLELITPEKTNDSQTKTAQCIALTKTGLRCKRKASATSDRCWQHQK